MFADHHCVCGVHASHACRVDRDACVNHHRSVACKCTPLYTDVCDVAISLYTNEYNRSIGAQNEARDGSLCEYPSLNRLVLCAVCSGDYLVSRFLYNPLTPVWPPVALENMDVGYQGVQRVTRTTEKPPRCHIGWPVAQLTPLSLCAHFTDLGSSCPRSQYMMIADDLFTLYGRDVHVVKDFLIDWKSNAGVVEI